MRPRSLLVASGVVAAVAACSINARHFIDASVVEECAIVAGVADCADPACAAEPSCQPACGNGRVDPGEECDDGNLADGDGCDGNCTLPACGNGVIDPGEVCDPPTPLRCSADCKSTLACGNGIMDPGEDCDDTNTSNNDNCRNDCVLNRCGDGFINTLGSPKEQCDGAPAAKPGVKVPVPTNTATCNADCTPAVCGDGKPNPAAGEQCDKGIGNNDSSDCKVSCQINVCGDGKLDTIGPAHFEECDDGNLNNNDGCDSNCTTPRCGNGIVNTGEVCDNFSSGCGACSTDCKTATSSAATGTIVATKGSDFLAGDGFTLNDGFNQPVVFQFTSGTPTGTQIKFDAIATNVDMATRIATAINASAAGGLRITAAASATPGTLTLTHTQLTSNGNRAVTETVQTVNFRVTGMAGGQGGNCASLQPCTQGIDCLSQRCVNSRCQ
jgi:cysteine-rich repeat protein